ncbi:hypothetical protein TVAG_074930 [Trichomonas vaginalis G3]|uniref:Uncharacterized protein n=1 Tax=Trichomonas vaginalis (strain ATCC PRA-98 / G3) TaxID=412133 RepID=A2E410_TRIV3|nr:hypothetical protein TVAGG3_0147460 [Trichomonas vaginalis G3]EAY12665.1 hypothetical protein TVAG_074930 [Trichomonas vaginalis G3]KAI5547027.1 hypothetical protein TVAGG3_0147460 [Trichomonas vaginalis G3]|eukprot:XP_001324888.1 hypothetical protein [Trichomonas vaginalis G3]
MGDHQINSLPELNRVVESLQAIENILKREEILVEINSSNGKVSARIKIEQDLYDLCTIYTTLNAQTGGEVSYKISSYPVTEFHSILSIISPLIPKMRYLAKNPSMLTVTLAEDAHRDILQCERILTVREFLTNSEITPDWASSIEPAPPENLLISVFPFRDSFYVSIYMVQPTTDPLREMHVHSTPFNYSPKSVVQINGQRYMIEHSIIASQCHQTLTRILRLIHSANEDLETLSSLKKSQL